MLIVDKIKSDGKNYFFPYNVFEVQIYNYTQAKKAAGFAPSKNGAKAPVQFAEGDPVVWAMARRDMPTGEAFAQQKDGSYSVITNAMTFYDSTKSSLGPLLKVSAISAADPPVVTGDKGGVKKGDIVRIINVEDAKQISGMDFTVGNKTLSDTTFSLDYMQKLDAAGKAGFYRIVNPAKVVTQNLRYITKITKGTETVITFSVTHPYTKGQVLRFVVYKSNGMKEINGREGIITSVDTENNTVTVDIDSSSFSDFVFPKSADNPCTPAHVVVSGVGSCAKGGSITNEATSGWMLAGGKGMPMGEADDEIYISAKAYGTSAGKSSCCADCNGGK